MVPCVFPYYHINTVLFKRAGQFYKVNSTFGIMPDDQVRFEVGGAQVIWWPVLLSGKVHSDVVVLAPVTVTVVATDETCTLS